MTERQFHLFMFINLFKQMEVWSTVFKGCYNQKAKRDYNQMTSTIYRFLNTVEKDLKGFEDKLHDDSEMFSKILEQIAKSKNKDQCLQLLIAYNNNELTFVDEA